MNWANRENRRRRFGTIATPPTEEGVEEGYEDVVKVVQSNGVHKEEFVEEHKSTHRELSDENSNCDDINACSFLPTFTIQYTPV